MTDFLNLGNFILFSISFLSENRDIDLTMHSSIPSPMNTLSGCNFLCEKNPLM